MADPAAPFPTPELLAFTAQIVASHIAATKMAPDEVPALINAVYGALAHAGAPASKQMPQEPAVPIKRSIQHDYLVCLEDGAKVKTLKRYLVRFGLTPETYRAKWGLPRDYPMVAPASSARRSALAKQTGLGSAPRMVEQSAPAEPERTPDLPEEPAVQVEHEAQHTAASVFANFPGGNVPQETPVAANDAEKPGRKRFAQQFMRVERRRG